MTYGGNTTRVDGAIDTSTYPDIIAYVPPEESIESVNVVTNNFNADQGMGGGSTIQVITKSGTNQFHGSAWEYNHNSALDARNYFNYQPKIPKDILNHFGAAIGGPIKRNKLFFFADWERMMERMSVSGYQTVPTAAMKQGDFSGAGTTIYDPSTGLSSGKGRTAFANNQIPTSMLNAASLKMASLLPAPNISGTVSNDYFASTVYRFTRDNIDTKINYIPSSRSSVFIRYGISPSDIFDPPALGQAGGSPVDGGQPGNAFGKIQDVVIGGTYTLAPNVVLDGNVGFTRVKIGAENVDIHENYGLDVLHIPGTNGADLMQGGYPYFAVSGISSFGNSNTSNPFLNRDNQYLGDFNLHWTEGNHSLAFGGEIYRYTRNASSNSGTFGMRGGFSFTGGLTSLNGGAAPNLYNAWADYLLGLPQSLGKTYLYINPSAIRENVFGFYGQDRWQIGRRLTLTYALRYEIYPYCTSDHFGGMWYNPATNITLIGGKGGIPQNPGVNTGNGNLGPRFGIAYRVTDRTVMRAGYGITTEPGNFRYMVNMYPFVLSSTYTGANSYSAAGSLTTGIPSMSFPSLAQGTVALPAGYGTYTFPQKYRRGYEEFYNYAVQRNIGGGLSAEVAFVSERAIRQPLGVNLNTAAPGTGAAGQPFNQAWGNTAAIYNEVPLDTSDYDALQVRVTRHVGNAQLAGTYTYSKTIDYGDNENSSLSFPWPPVFGHNKGLAGFDRTHNLEIFTTYDSPFGKNQRWLNSGFASAILGGWRLNGMLSRQSGTPFTVASSATSLNAPGNSQTANQVKTSVAILGGHGPGQPYFDPYAFNPVTTASFGSSGRNILRGPGAFNLHAGVFRNFSVERLTLQFRAEAYNMTNTPNFSNPGATVSNATWSNGVIKNLNSYDVISSASGSRVFEFGLKLEF